MAEILPSVSVPDARPHADHGSVEPTSLPGTPARNDGAQLAGVHRLRSTVADLRRTVGLDGDDAVIAGVRSAWDSIP